MINENNIKFKFFASNYHLIGYKYVIFIIEYNENNLQAVVINNKNDNKLNSNIINNKFDENKSENKGKSIITFHSNDYFKCYTSRINKEIYITRGSNILTDIQNNQGPSIYNIVCSSVSIASNVFNEGVYHDIWVEINPTIKDICEKYDNIWINSISSTPKDSINMYNIFGRA